MRCGSFHHLWELELTLLVVVVKSTRNFATSQALFRGVSLEDICVAAGWSSPHTFIKFYILELDSQVLFDAWFEFEFRVSAVAPCHQPMNSLIGMILYRFRQFTPPKGVSCCIRFVNHLDRVSLSLSLSLSEVCAVGDCIVLFSSHQGILSSGNQQRPLPVLPGPFP